MRVLRWCPLLLLLGCGQVNGTGDPAPDAMLPDGEMSPGDGSAQLALSTARTWIHQGETLPVHFTVARKGAAGDLVIQAATLPAGVTAEDVIVPATSTEGTLTLVATGAATAGAAAEVSVQVLAGTKLADARKLTLLVAGTAGDPDTRWGSSGVRTITLHDPGVGNTAPASAEPTSIAVYPASAGEHAGKVVVAGIVHTLFDGTGRAFVARFKADGTIDNGFGEATDTGRNGAVIILDYEAITAKVAIDSVGRIVLAFGGSNKTGTDQAIGLYRLTTSGELDSKFKTSYGKPAGAGFAGGLSALRVLGLDKILLVGIWNRPSGGWNPSLSVFSADGTPDGAFGSNGSTVIAPARGDANGTELFAMTVDSKGRFVGAGRNCDGGWQPAATNCSAMVVRYTAGGEPDATFGKGTGNARSGYTEVNFGDGALFRDVAVGAGDAVIAVGSNGGSTRATVARLKGDNGTLDTSFATTGAETIDLGGGATFFAVAVDAAGRLVLTGHTTGAVQRVRLDDTGKRDLGFGATTVSGNGLKVGVLAADDQLVATFATPRVGTDNATDVSVRRFWP